MSQDDLFGGDDNSSDWQPLAARLRPTELNHFIGQRHLLGEGQALRSMIISGRLHSMVLWGPPGVGKTSLAKVISKECHANFVSISAVLGGVKEIRQVIEAARLAKESKGAQTVLFVDEVHRLNKAQQDLFLPFVENGTIVFIGATTENPSFELNNALLSRSRVYVLKGLAQEELNGLIDVALNDPRSGLADYKIQFPEKHRQTLIQVADGDARRLLNLIEIAVDLAERVNDELIIDEGVMALLLQGDHRRFDKGGDHFYEQISALHKSVRGSAPDAALYWLVRMLDGGCDPLYIARRVVRMASEDIGNADPRALGIALDAWDVVERLGSPEGELSLAQAVVYLACAAKSNAVYKAYNKVVELVKRSPAYEVPMHLRNAPTRMMKEMGYGQGYRYAHDERDGYAAGESYLPADIAGTVFYQPVPRGLEIKIQEKLRYLRKLDAESSIKR
ncbi:MAG: recombination factor protein RarA [Gammaproteobacteria bacterium]|nr:MAG: recombination factor protein RarA [Gammaproteobacteria bacterium]